MNYKLEVTLPELQYLAGALKQRPYIEVADLLAKLQAQVVEQEAAQQKEKPADNGG